MDFKSHFDNIRDFLAPYKDFWYAEILNCYPNSLDPYPEHWLDELDQMPDEQLWRIDCRNDYEARGTSEFDQFVREIKSLTKMDRKELNSPDNLEPWAFHKVKEKKRHEILKITEELKTINSKHSISHTVDIGGGVGHLSRIMAHYYGIDSICLDMNKDFQEIGKKRLTKYPKPTGAGDVNFVNIKFGVEKDKEKALAPVFAQDAFTIGLHTCGPLAVNHMQTNLKFKTKGLLNFGCCYNKMDPSIDVNISNHSKINPLKLSNHALTLATRGHTEMTFEEYQIKERVKAYRYALFLFHWHKLGIKEFISVGEAHLRHYRGNFSDYALLKLEQLNIDHDFSADKLDEFFNQDWVQKILRKMFLANIIRWQLGRVLEHYILTDRCIFLEENNLEVEMMEYFDEKLSPRNIGIKAIRI